MSRKIKKTSQEVKKLETSRVVKLDTPLDKVVAALEFLSTVPFPPAPLPQSQVAANDQLLLCSPPNDRTGPTFVVAFRRPLLIAPLPPPVVINFTNESTSVEWPSLACTKVNSANFSLAFDLKFEQAWNLTGLTIGDLSSTISLAPSEKLTLEFQSSQRKVLQQDTLDSTETIDSSESTSFDKEVMNVVRASSKTDNWHVDTSGSVSVSYAGVGANASVSAGMSSTTTNSSQSTLDHISETTKKSARSLKTLHKIEVRGLSESLVQNRMTRVIKNPYTDRTLSLNVFQLIKHFSAQAQLTQIRLALMIQINSLNFDKDFVVSNADFLQDKLLDQSLIDNLPTALQAAQPASSNTEAVDMAILALRFLFDEPNIFNIPPNVESSPVPPVPADPNLPANSFNASIAGLSTPVLAPSLTSSGLDDAIKNDWGVTFTVLNFFYKIYRNLVASNALIANALSLVNALEGGVGTQWSSGAADQSKDSLKKVLSNLDYTEIFRRLSGFFAMVDGMVKPLLSSLDTAAQAQANFVLIQLINHLNCHQHYYTQQFINYTAQKTNNIAIFDFITLLFERAAILSPSNENLLPLLFDVDRSFIDRQEIIVPSFSPLDETQVSQFSNMMTPNTQSEFHFGDVTPTTIVDLEVPCDGIHLEVAEGACVLGNVPPSTGVTVDLTIHDANLQVNVS